MHASMLLIMSSLVRRRANYASYKSEGECRNKYITKGERWS